MSAKCAFSVEPSPRTADQKPPNVECCSEDIEFWSTYLLPRFQAYLSEARSYTNDQEAAHVECLCAALPSLGPKLPHPYTRSMLTYNGLPIELSMNISDNRNATARFYIEPISRTTGTDRDPFGESAFLASFSRLVPQMTSVDAKWFHHLDQAFRLESQEEFIAAKIQTLSRPNARLPKGFMGVDFAGGNRTLKCTFCPLQKFFATGGEWNKLANVNERVIEVVRQLPDAGAAMGHSLDALEQYLFQEPGDHNYEDVQCHSCTKGQRPKPFFNLVSVDCVDPRNGQARVKLYTRIQCNAFACIRDAVTLGGRLKDKTTLESLRRLKAVWHLLLNDPASENDEEYCRPMNVERILQGIDINWEISGRQSVPDTKVYVPVYMFHKNDFEVHNNLRIIFRKLTWDQWADGRYERMLHQVAYVLGSHVVVFHS